MTLSDGVLLLVGITPPSVQIMRIHPGLMRVRYTYSNDLERVGPNNKKYNRVTYKPMIISVVELVKVFR